MNNPLAKNILVSVVAEYDIRHSFPEKNKYVFRYKVHIHNNNDVAVQLLRRQWFIFDSSGSIREISGEGVIGKQPVIEPGNAYFYESWSPLETPMGEMWGKYIFTAKGVGSFNVKIPNFRLEANFKLN